MVGHIWNPSKHSESGGMSYSFRSATTLSLFFVVYGSVSLLSEVLVPLADHARYRANFTEYEKPGPPPADKVFSNPLYTYDEDYRNRRRPELLGLSRREANFGRRLIASAMMGAFIGLERRAPNRPAGVRTMALVSLGSCLFTIASAYAFEEGSQEWDASRISAALPSGVGFIGGAVIFKQGGEVIGLTTATGIWTSCAVGVCCGGEMYFVAMLGCSGMVFLLRFGPRMPEFHDADEEVKQSDPMSWKAESSLQARLLPTESQERAAAVSKAVVPFSREGSVEAEEAEERESGVKRKLSLGCDT